MEPAAVDTAPFLDIDFSFRNTTRDKFQVASKHITAQVVSFQNDGKEQGCS